MGDSTVTPSPRWGAMTKLVIALTMIAILAALLIRFQALIVPIMLAFIVAYLLYPLASLLDRKLSWRLSVTIVYLLLIVLLISLATLGGLGLVSQIESLISVVENSIKELPSLATQAVDWININTPFILDLNTINLDALSQQLLSMVQPLLGSTGQMLGAIAGGAAGFFGWAAFTMLISYFIMTESGGLRTNLLKIELPGYVDDFMRLGQELRRIWNAFLRGQMIVFSLAVVFYLFVLSVLGVRYAIGLALLAGISKFLPYIGPAMVWITLGLVSYFQPFKLFGMGAFQYTLLVFIVALIFDQALDGFITPRIMGQALKVHPAAVLTSALIGADLLGILGIIIAAPMLATFILLGRYTMRKMLDQNPWQAKEPSETEPGPTILERLREWWQSFQLRLKRKKQ